MRRALLQFGLGRWDKIRASLRPPSLEKRDVDDCVLASWDFVRAVAERCAGREARYLVGRLRAAPKIEHHPDPLVGPWSKVPQNASQWARRLRLLDDVNRAAERCLAEETQDEALAMFATMPDPKLPPWWNPDCDLFLLHGAREHGFGKYDETLRDATCRPGFERAARDAGPDAEAALRASARKSEEAAELAKDATIGGTAKHAPGCGCFACKAARRMSLTSADEGDDGDGDEAAAAKKKDEIEDEKAAADAEMADANDDDDDDDDDVNDDVNEEDDMDEEDDLDADEGEEDGASFGASIRSEATDGDVASRAAAVSAAAERAAEARKAKLAAKRREARARARAAEESADPNAWPTSETLTNRLRALAKTIGAPEALAPSDPPWVAVALGRPRVRPRRRDPFGFGSAAANDPARRERKRAKREARDRAESRAANAMANLDWEALGGHPPSEGADGAGATGDVSEEEEMRACERRFEAAKRRTANFTKRDKNRIVKAAMGHGLPTRSDGNPDWNALARLAEVRGKSEEEIRDGFETIALEMGLLTRATKGKATRHREPAHLHKSTCKCIVCRIKRQKAEASADADSAAPTPGGSPEPDRSGDAPGGNTPERDEEEDSDDDDDAFIMRQASGADADGDGDGDGDVDGDGDGDGDGDDEETPGKNRDGGDGDGEPGAKRKNKGNKPHGLLSVITADRLRKRLDMMQNLRMATSFAGGASRLPLPVITTKELPEWWSGAPHVVALVEGALRHGCEDWDAVASDPKLPFAARAAEAGEPDSARLPIPRMCVHVLLIVSRFLRRGPLKKWIAEEKARAKARGR